MPQIELNGTQFHTQTLGRGEPVVMLHGLLVGNMMSWYFGAAHHLSKSHEVFLYDLRGHGLSQMARTGYDLETMVFDLDGLTKKFSEPLTLIGHSYGALIALHYAIRHPKRVSRLVLVEAPLPPSRWQEMEEFIQKSPEEMFQALPTELREALWTQKRQARRLIERLRFLTFETEILKNFKNEGDISDSILKNINVPVLLVYGKDSALTDVGQRLAKVIPQAKIEWIRGGHYLPSENSSGLTKVIAQFLDLEVS